MLPLLRKKNPDELRKNYRKVLVVLDVFEADRKENTCSPEQIAQFLGEKEKYIKRKLEWLAKNGWIKNGNGEYHLDTEIYNKLDKNEKTECFKELEIRYKKELNEILYSLVLCGGEAYLEDLLRLPNLSNIEYLPQKLNLLVKKGDLEKNVDKESEKEIYILLKEDFDENELLRYRNKVLINL